MATFSDDAGYALAMVLGIGLVLMLMIVTATTYSISGFQATRSDQNWNGALAAAYAGVDEYQSRLAADSSYGQYGNPEAAFSIATLSGVRLPAKLNPAFEVTAGGAWGSVVGSDGTGSFRYEVDNSKFASHGQLRLRVTGKVGSETRSIVANLKGEGFINYIYFTDFEIADPALNLDSKTQKPTCANPVHAWETTTFRTGCTEINFAGGDELAGPVHSNDIMHICDATFTGEVTSAYPTKPYYSPTNARQSDTEIRGCSGQKFNGGLPAQGENLPMPETNNSLLDETAVNLPNTVPRPGCLYTGPTSIEFLSNGYMRVISPWTKYTQRGALNATPSPGVTKTACGTPGVSGLGATNGELVKIPTDNLIFVQEPPADSSDPNYWASNKNPSTSSPKNAATYPGCTGSNANTDSAKGQLAVSGNGIGFPTSGTVKSGSKSRVVNEKPPLSNSYGCRAGDVFVKGVVHGRVTVASSNYLYVTGDLTYTNPNDPAQDMLGLIGGKAVWVWDPLYADFTQDKITYTQNDFVYGDANRTIQAAIMSVENTFTVQNYKVAGSGGGRRGELRVTGSIAQRFRGIVAEAGGYVKKYKYDRRFLTTAPPKYLSPVSTSYGVSSYGDVKVAYRADGTTQ